MSTEAILAAVVVAFSLLLVESFLSPPQHLAKLGTRSTPVRRLDSCQPAERGKWPQVRTSAASFARARKTRTGQMQPFKVGLTLTNYSSLVNSAGVVTKANKDTCRRVRQRCGGFRSLSRPLSLLASPEPARSAGRGRARAWRQEHTGHWQSTNSRTQEGWR